MANTQPDVAYHALPDTPADAIDVSQPLPKSNLKQSEPQGLPKLQMLAYAGIRSSEPFMFFVLATFINELIVEYGIANDPKSTGYAAGLLEAVVWIANAAVMMPWIYIADIYGRRPVLLGATGICTIIGLMIGFPRSFATLLFLRFLAGFWNGQSAVAKTYLAELVDESTEATAFAFQSLAWQVGWSSAGAAGGYLSHPERYFPSLANNSFIQQYPFALGPLAASIIPLCSVAFGYFIMRETLPPGGFRAPLKMNSNMWSALHVWYIMVSCNISFMAILPLFMFAPVDAGGMGLTTVAIGRYYVIRAAVIISVEFPIYPRLHRRFGHSKMLKGQILLYPIIFTLCPLVSMSRRYFHEDNLDPITFILLGTMLALEALAQTIFISGDLLCTNAAPEKSLQSKYNAVVELVAKLGQITFTWIVSWLFAFSAETQIFWGYLVWIALIANATYGVSRTFKLKETEGWRRRETSECGSPMTPMTAQYD